MTHDIEWDAWLDAATRGLPDAAARTARAELSAHYQDALADALDGGNGEREARRLALARLGPAEEVASGLLDAHIGRRQYLIAAGLCLWNLVMEPVLHFALWFEGTATQEHVLQAAAFFALLIPTLAILRITQMFIEWRLRAPHARLMVGLSMAGVMVTLLATTLPLFAEQPAETITATVPILFVGLVAAGCGTLALAVTCARSRAGLFGLGWPLAGLGGVIGLGLLAVPAGALLSEFEVSRAGFLALSAAQVGLWPVLMIVFYRAVYREQRLPLRTA